MTHPRPAAQTVPVRVYEGDTRIMVAAPMPGLEPGNITVTIAGQRIAIRGDEPGSRQDERDLRVAEWRIGPYFRELEVALPVSGRLANATYGNGVLVLVLPKLRPGEAPDEAEFTLQVLDAPRGQRIGHHGHDLTPTTTAEHRRQTEEVARSAGAPRTSGTGDS